MPARTRSPRRRPRGRRWDRSHPVRTRPEGALETARRIKASPHRREAHQRWSVSCACGSCSVAVIADRELIGGENPEGDKSPGEQRALAGGDASARQRIRRTRKALKSEERQEGSGRGDAVRRSARGRLWRVCALPGRARRSGSCAPRGDVRRRWLHLRSKTGRTSWSVAGRNKPARVTRIKPSKPGGTARAERARRLASSRRRVGNHPGPEARAEGSGRVALIPMERESLENPRRGASREPKGQVGFGRPRAAARPRELRGAARLGL